MKRISSPPVARAFTIVELIVAMAIISILTLIMVPALNSRAKEAKIGAAQADLQALADAEERAGVQTNFLYRVYVLDDSRGGDGVTPAALANDNNGSIRDTIDGVRDNAITSNNMYENPSWIFIETLSQDFSVDQSKLFDRLTAGINDPLNNTLGSTGEKDFNWNGPYINWKRDANKNDWPDDPWGNDYLLFTRKGVIYPPTRDSNGVPVANSDKSFEFQALVTGVTVGQASGNGTTTADFKADDIFDRPTFLSLGPNGLPGDGTDATNNTYGQGDDLVQTFGGGQ